jgi:anthranilate synthase component 1
MVIPTGAWRPGAGWDVHLQAGAGVVLDSVPEAEYEETVAKSSALVRAIDLAERAFSTGSASRPTVS